MENKLIIDALPTLTTQQDEISSAADDEKVEKHIRKHDPIMHKHSKNKWIDLRRDYVGKLIIIFIISLLFGVAFGVAVIFTPYYDEFGLYIVCSKFTSGSILFWAMTLMLFISHDLMTLIRSNWKWKLVSWFDHYFVIHRFAAYLVTINGLIHSAWHLAGSIRIISNSKDIQNTNNHMSRNVFLTAPTYGEILFETIPGITGWIMLSIIILMAITSMKWIREKWFQVFGYIHMMWFPIFLIAMIIHGFGFWFRLGTPFAIIFCNTCLCYYDYTTINENIFWSYISLQNCGCFSF